MYVHNTPASFSGPRQEGKMVSPAKSPNVYNNARSAPTRLENRMNTQTDNSAVLSYATPSLAHNTWHDIGRRAGLWALLCTVSAAPSFVWAAPSFDRVAMVVGVMLFIMFY